MAFQIYIYCVSQMEKRSGSLDLYLLCAPNGEEEWFLDLYLLCAPNGKEEWLLDLYLLCALNGRGVALRFIPIVCP